MKLFKSKETIHHTYESLQKNRGKIKRMSLLFAFFVLGVNIYAWFVFIAKANLDVEANVVSWDINFFDENTEVKDLSIKERLYPGMPNYEKTVTVTNSSETNAEFEYEIDRLSILGIDSIPVGATNDEVIESLNNDYPFKIHFQHDKNQLAPGDSLTFQVFMDWEYENANLYYKLTQHYTFDPSLVYYNLENGVYVENNTINSSNFEVNKLNLYLLKDDADSFFGEACDQYETATGKACVSYHVVLKVTQTN